MADVLDRSPDAVRPLAWLVRLAVDSDDPAPLVVAAGSELGRPLGLVSAIGEPLGHAPDGISGRRALAVAGAAARATAVPPAGWRIVPIAHARARLAVLAVADADDARDDERAQLLALIATLLREQLTRAALRRGQVAAFVRRLVTPPGLGAERARREAAAVGVAPAGAYRPAVLAWPSAARSAGLAERVDREARALARAALTATLDEHLVLLHPSTGDDPVAWFERLVGRVRALAQSSSAQAVAADRVVPLEALSGEVSRLLRLADFGPCAEASPPVVGAGRYALDRLLWDNLDGREARAFVEDRLGALVAWDREHGSDLLRVLEAALDHPRHDRAASRCFMHRNTFRHHLRQATDMLGEDIDDPDVRLAVHVALKLRHGLSPAA
jgi:PucR C-terminal helix-turn-helix domain/GGDEF-like domain